MKKMKFHLIFSILLLIATVSNAQNKYKTTSKDFQKLVGSWQGSLTYLDYSSGKPYTRPADIEIRKIKKTNKFVFTNIYPKETNANSVDTIIISNDGTFIDKETVKSRQQLANGNIEIVTEELGKDGNENKQATIRHTYTFGKKSFSKRKDIQFAGEKEWINRHQYLYNRKSGN